MTTEPTGKAGELKRTTIEFENKKRVAMKLTVKQENFCQAYIETGNASEAYRTAYNASKMKPESINRKAKELLDNGKITARVNQLQNSHEERHKITVDDLLEELEESRKAALTAETPQASAAIAATMGKAKLLGLDKQVVDLKSSDGSMTPKAALNKEQMVEIVKELKEVI